MLRRSCLPLLVAGVAAALCQAPPAQAYNYLLHTADAGNTVLDATFIDDPLLNGNPNAILIVTQNWNPGAGVFGVYNPHEIGVSYSTSSARWSIYNEDSASMPLGASFNVWVREAAVLLFFVHTTGAGNTPPGGSWTVLDSAFLNDCPTARPQVTHQRNPGGGSGPRHDHTLELFYSTLSGRWEIYNSDLASMALGVSFDVFVNLPCSPGDSWRARNWYPIAHAATSGNTFFNFTNIDSSVSNGLEHATLFVSARGVGPVPLNPHPMGVWYNSDTDQWSIFNEDLADMPVGAEFFVMVVPSLFFDDFETGDTSRWSSAIP